MPRTDPKIRATFLERRGMELALDMLAELEDIEPIEGLDGEETTLADTCQFEAEYRHGHPFRNIVHERLQVARKAGPEAEQGFCAVLCEVVTLNMQGSVPVVYDLEKVIREQVANA